MTLIRHAIGSGRAQFILPDDRFINAVKPLEHRSILDMTTTQYTERGFSFVEFEDASGTACNIQKSSLATDDAIWLGAKEIGLKKFTPYVGWEDQDTRGNPPHGETYIANNRMHLTRDQVAALLPILSHFVETGEVSAPSEAALSIPS